MERELEKNRETLENKRRKSCGPICIKPFPGRKYIMQSGIGEVVLRRNSGGGKQWGKMSRITGYIQPTRPAGVSFATVGFVKLGHDCDRQKFPRRHPSRSLTVTILRNGTSISRGEGRGTERSWIENSRTRTRLKELFQPVSRAFD